MCSSDLAALNKVQSNLLSASDRNKLAGGLLAATVDNPDAAKTVIANTKDVTAALKAVANEVNIADVVGAVEDAINTSEGLTSVTTADLISSLREVVDGDVLSSIAAEVNYEADDAACIGGFPCSEDDDASRSASITAKKNDLITLTNASYEKDDAATYQYSWSIFFQSQVFL